MDVLIFDFRIRSFDISLSEKSLKSTVLRPFVVIGYSLNDELKIVLIFWKLLSKANYCRIDITQYLV